MTLLPATTRPNLIAPVGYERIQVGKGRQWMLAIGNGHEQLLCVQQQVTWEVMNEY